MDLSCDRHYPGYLFRCLHKHTLTGNHSFSGGSSSLINEKNPHGPGLKLNPLSYFTTGNRIVKVTAMVWSASGNGGASVVLDLTSDSGYSCYEAFYMEKFIRPGRWMPIECAFYLPKDMPGNTLMRLYFFHPRGTPATYIDDMTIGFISMKEEQEYMKIEGVLLSCQ